MKGSRKAARPDGGGQDISRLGSLIDLGRNLSDSAWKGKVERMLQSVLLMAYTLAAGVTTWLSTNLLFRDRPGWWRGVVAVAFFPIPIVISLTALGMAGLLTPHSGGILMLVIGGVLLVVTRHMQRARRPAKSFSSVMSIEKP